jgi:hypothetical protein
MSHEALDSDHPSMWCDQCGCYHAENCPEQEDYPEGMGHRQDTWPDLDDECETYIKAAFATLSRAPGYRDRYARVQSKLAEAIRILRGTE